MPSFDIGYVEAGCFKYAVHDVLRGKSSHSVGEQIGQIFLFQQTQYSCW